MSRPDQAQLLDQLRASAADLNPCRAAIYAAADPEWWEHAKAVAVEVLVLAAAHRISIVEGAAFHRDLAQILRHTDEATLVAAVAWQLQASAFLPASPASLVPAEQGAR